MNKPFHIIVEGVELAGKSFVMHELYSQLEPTLSSQQPFLLDGCHWFNCDVGVWGTDRGTKIISSYIDIAETLHDKHLLFEKFHIADQVYNHLYQNKQVSYTDTEERLSALAFVIVFLTIAEDEKLLAKRLKDRIALYPHYERIAQQPKQYIEQQKLFKHYIAKSSLPTLQLDSTTLPNPSIIEDILTWLNKH